MGRRASRLAGVILSIAYLAANVMVFLLYIFPGLNSPEPVFAGLSVAFAYSLLAWVLLMAVVIAAAVFAWRG